MAYRKRQASMRLVALTALAVTLGWSVAAQAALWDVEATLEIQITPGLPTVTATGVGQVDLTAGTLALPASLVTLSSATFPVTATTAIDSLQVSGLANQAATFSIGGVTAHAPGEICAVPPASEACVSGGGLGGLMGLTGIVNVVVIPGVVVLPIDLNALGVGQGGAFTTGYYADAAPWTTGTGRMGLVTTGGTTTVSSVGSNGAGSLTLVTPTFVSACGNILPVMTRFTLTSIPEPGALALLAAGGLALGLLRRARR
jgi:hypothetical protein